MKTKLMVFIVAGTLAVLLGTTAVYAAGTPAGTVIKNVASMTYKDLSGNSFPTLYSDTASVTVEQVAGVTLTPTGSLQYSSDSMYVYFAHTVTNTGNGSDTYNLTSADSASWSPTIFFDANGNGVWDSGETSVVSSTGSLAADAQYKIIIRLFVPNNVTSGLLDTIRTAATSTFNNGTDPIASAWVRDSIRTRVAEVSVNKTNNNATPTPGQTITYTITYSNNGTGTAESSELIDTLNSNVTYVGGSASIISGGGSVSFASSPDRIIWTNIGNGGDIYGGATGQITFQVTVNSGVPAGTIISNRATLTYNDSISGRTKKPVGGPTTSTVSSSASWDLKVAVIGSAFVTDNAQDSVNVTQSVYFKLKLTNTGNRTDSATFTRTSSLPLTWTMYKDVNENGSYDSGTDVLFNLSSDTVIVAQDDSVFFIAVDTVAQSVADRSRDSAYYQATSVTQSASADGYHITRVKAPVMALTKSVTTQSGRSRPGDTLIYTITYTNTGSGTANQIVISDVSPTNTTYLGNSVSINNSANGNTFTAKTDDADADEVEVSSGTITVTLGSVGPGMLGNATYTGQIRFKVKID
ncbi:MAG: isopeptide-forming domain-containing fimbrial protein [Bacteroidota bacterium]